MAADDPYADWQPGELVGRGRTARLYRGATAGTVVKLFEPWVPAEAIECEAAALAALAGSFAPAIHGHVEHGERSGLVLDLVPGRRAIAEVRARPWRIRDLSREMGRVQARFARTAAPGLPSLSASLRRAIDAAAGADAAARPDPAAVRAACVALDGLPDGDRLCHGDYHPDNIVVSRSGSLTVLDWAAARRGVPEADVARTLVLLSVGRLPAGRRLDAAMVRLARRYVLAEYRRERLRQGDVTAPDVARWLLPVAVARFAERIDADRPALDRLVDGLMARGATRR